MTRAVSYRLFHSASLILALALPSFGALSYTCDPNIDTTHAGTCAYLNSTIAALYNNTFSNVNANIYVQYGNTELGESEYSLSYVTYSSFIAALTANSQSSGNAVQALAVTALNGIDTGLYGNYMVALTGALTKALGFQFNPGTTPAGGVCVTAGAGCYDGVIVVTTNSTGTTPLFYRSGTEAPDAYDFYAVVEHETDEVLGTGSCIDTPKSGLANDCGSQVLAAVDLFRYQSAGNPVLISTTPGAYFSYDGGQNNGGGTYKKVYNTVADGDDYADFRSSNPCQRQQSIQDAEGCPGFDGGLDITNDGGAEINILNALGYKMGAQTTSTPTIRPSGIVPVDSAVSTVQPGEWIAIYGSNLGPATPVNWNGDFPKTLGGTSVNIDGIPAYMYYVSAGQVNVQVPDDANVNRPVSVVVNVGSQSVTSTVNLANVAPSLALLGDNLHVAGIIIRTDGSGAYGNGGYDIIGPAGTSLGYKTVPAKEGDRIELFGFGFGSTSPPIPAGEVFSLDGGAPTTNAVTLTIGKTPVATSFTGISQEGVYQFNLTVPAGIGTGDVSVAASVTGVSTVTGEPGAVIALQ